MPYANNQGIRTYYEIEGHGQPLVLQYGQYFPLQVWREYKYVDALRDDFQLILIDARGQEIVISLKCEGLPIGNHAH